jgi:hypothetical protein
MKTGVNKEVAGIIILVTGSSRSFMILFYFVFIIDRDRCDRVAGML